MTQISKKTIFIHSSEITVGISLKRLNVWIPSEIRKVNVPANVFEFTLDLSKELYSMRRSININSHSEIRYLLNCQ
jgi:hypothetical protein